MCMPINANANFNFPPMSQVRSEADVESKVLIPLFKYIGIINNDSDFGMRVPVRIQAGRSSFSKEADIVIYKNGNPFIVIEAKSPDAKINDEGIAQLDSYAMWLPAKFGVACDGINFILRGYFDGNRRVYLINKPLSQLNVDLLKSTLEMPQHSRIEDIPNHIIQDQSNSFSELLRKIHSDIRDIDKLDPTSAFDEWSKLLFLKINEEKWTKEHDGNRRLSYSRFKEEQINENAMQYISGLFKRTCEQYPNIFGSNQESLELSELAIENILKKFDGYFINEIPMDVKGKAYEIFLSSTFRGKGLGQFFTPRPVVNFMIDLVKIDLNTVVLDPACGTGGFLISAFQKIRRLIESTPDSVFSNWGTTKSHFLETVKDSHIYGVDAEPRATKTAKMNMIMWGDGENVVRGNGLDTKDIVGVDYPYLNTGISLILANPPFGNQEKKETILNQYELFTSNRIKKTECLFLEKALKTLAPNGQLAIVIPDGVLGCQPAVAVRTLIRKYAKIKAVISLPKHTFAPSGVPTINTSVLYLQKFPEEYLAEIENVNTPEEIIEIQRRHGLLNYNVFMGVAEQIGYEPNGSPSRSGINDLTQILDEYLVALENGMYESEEFREISDKSFVINSSKLINRIDSRYYWLINILDKKGDSWVELKEYLDKCSDSIQPKRDNPNSLFSIVSVTNSYGIILDEGDEKKFEVEGSNITKGKIVHTGDIAFNPYRVNVGSIGIVEEKLDGLLISPSYVVFRTKNGLDPKVLCSLMKTDFYSTYIDIVGIGSIRTSLGWNKLKTLKIPRTLIGEVQAVTDTYNKVAELQKQIKESEQHMLDTLSQFI